MTRPNPAELLTVTEGAQRSGDSRWTVGGWITGGKLPTERIAGRRYARPADLAAVQARAHVGDVVPAWRRNRRRADARLDRGVSRFCRGTPGRCSPRHRAAVGRGRDLAGPSLGGVPPVEVVTTAAQPSTVERSLGRCSWPPHF